MARNRFNLGCQSDCDCESCTIGQDEFTGYALEQWTIDSGDWSAGGGLLLGRGPGTILFNPVPASERDAVWLLVKPRVSPSEYEPEGSDPAVSKILVAGYNADNSLFVELRRAGACLSMRLGRRQSGSDTYLADEVKLFDQATARFGVVVCWEPEDDPYADDYSAGPNQCCAGVATPPPEIYATVTGPGPNGDGYANGFNVRMVLSGAFDFTTPLPPGAVAYQMFCPGGPGSSTRFDIIPNVGLPSLIPVTVQSCDPFRATGSGDGYIVHLSASPDAGVIRGRLTATGLLTRQGTQPDGADNEAAIARTTVQTEGYGAQTGLAIDIANWDWSRFVLKYHDSPDHPNCPRCSDGTCAIAAGDFDSYDLGCFWEQLAGVWTTNPDDETVEVDPGGTLALLRYIVPHPQRVMAQVFVFLPAYGAKARVFIGYQDGDYYAAEIEAVDAGCSSLRLLSVSGGGETVLETHAVQIVDLPVAGSFRLSLCAGGDGLTAILRVGQQDVHFHFARGILLDPYARLTAGFGAGPTGGLYRFRDWRLVQGYDDEHRLCHCCHAGGSCETFIASIGYEFDCRLLVLAGSVVPQEDHYAISGATTILARFGQSGLEPNCDMDTSRTLQVTLSSDAEGDSLIGYVAYKDSGNWLAAILTLNVGDEEGTLSLVQSRSGGQEVLATRSIDAPATDYGGPVAYAICVNFDERSQFARASVNSGEAVESSGEYAAIVWQRWVAVGFGGAGNGKLFSFRVNHHAFTAECDDCIGDLICDGLVWPAYSTLRFNPYVTNSPDLVTFCLDNACKDAFENITFVVPGRCDPVTTCATLQTFAGPTTASPYQFGDEVVAVYTLSLFPNFRPANCGILFRYDFLQWWVFRKQGTDEWWIAGKIVGDNIDYLVFAKLWQVSPTKPNLSTLVDEELPLVGYCVVTGTHTCRFTSITVSILS